MNLDGRIAIVTGSSRGIGRAIALALAENNVNLTINYVKNRDAALKTAEKVKELGCKAIIVQADVSNSSQVKRLVNETIKHYGKIDILVNNAGILAQNYHITEISEEEWNKIIDVNLKGVFLCCREVVPYMMRQGEGKIVNISSIAGKMGGTVGVAYAASKAGVIGLTMALARELAPHNITVNAVAPGPVDTEMLTPELKQKLEKLSPQGRIATPEEIAETVIFLLKNDHITGETINVNGGRYMD